MNNDEMQSLDFFISRPFPKHKFAGWQTDVD